MTSRPSYAGITFFPGLSGLPDGTSALVPDPALVALLGVGPCLYARRPRRRPSARRVRRIARGLAFLADRPGPKPCPHFHLPAARFRRAG